MTELANRDKRISAFLDGRMTEPEMAAFEAAMESDPAFAEEVARLSANDSLLRAAFAGPVEAGVDDALLTRMGLAAAPDQASGSGSAQVVVLASAQTTRHAPANDNRSGWQRWGLPLAGAVAAALVLTVTLRPGTEQPGLQTAEGAGFAQVMETAPSRQAVRLAQGDTLTPLLTFQAGDGRYCREYNRSGSSAATGIACREGNGWRVEGEAAYAPDLAESGEIATAGGAQDADMDAIHARLGTSDPLGAEAERSLISSGWKNIQAR
jgi:hypothetical protein